MPAPTFNLTGEALRNKLLTYVNVGTKATPVWEIQGVKTEDASYELNPDVSTLTDILGDTYTNVNKMEPTLTMDPNTLRMGAKLNETLVDIYRRQAWEELFQFQVLTVWGMLGSSGAYEADLEDDCTIYPNSIGGDSRVNMPYTINLSNKRQKGTVNALYPATEITFTPTVEP